MLRFGLVLEFQKKKLIDRHLFQRAWLISNDQKMSSSKDPAIFLTITMNCINYTGGKIERFCN